MEITEHQSKKLRIGLLHFFGAGDAFIGAQKMVECKQEMVKLGYPMMVTHVNVGIRPVCSVAHNFLLPDHDLVPLYSFC